MRRIFSFVFDIGNVLFTQQRSIDYAGAETASFTPIEEGLAILKECHALSVRDNSLLLACTNLKKREITLLQEQFPDTIALFKGIVSPDVACAKKPDLALFHYMLATYAIIPEYTLYFDDCMSNVEAARSLGIKGLYVPTSAHLRKAITHYIPDF